MKNVPFSNVYTVPPIISCYALQRVSIRRRAIYLISAPPDLLLKRYIQKIVSGAINCWALKCCVDDLNSYVDKTTHSAVFPLKSIVDLLNCYKYSDCVTGTN